MKNHQESQAVRALRHHAAAGIFTGQSFLGAESFADGGRLGFDSGGPPPERRRARILVVDDNAEMLDVYRKILCPEETTRADRLNEFERALFDAPVSSPTAAWTRDFELVLVSDGKSALAHVVQARRDKRPFAMAFVDIRMPGGWDGLETAQKIWSVDPEIHVVLCTAYSDYSWEQMQERLSHPERFVVLRKPFDVTEIRQLAHSFCERWAKRLEDDDRMRTMVERLKEEGREARDALEASVRRTQRILHCLGDVAFVFDREWCVIYASEAASERFGLPENEVIGQNFWMALSGSEQSEMYRIGHDAVKAKAPRKTVEFCRKLNRLVEISVFPYGDEIYLLIQDPVAGPNSQAEEGEEQDDQLRRDDLTGLPDRLSGLQYLQRAAEISQDFSSALAIVLCDIDHLRELNELAGYAGGDRFVAELGRRIQALTADGVFAARTSGGEFLVVLEGEAAREALAWADRLSGALSEPFTMEGIKLESTVSIGVAVKSGADVTAGDLMRQASAALAFAKADGGAVVRSCEDESVADWRMKIELRSEMAAALTSSEFELFYQPQVCLHDARVVGAEALIRWRHPRWGLLMPADFLGVAEESSLISRIDRWVVDRACRQLAAWIGDRVVADDFVLSINISAREICDEKFPSAIKESIDRHRIPPERIELEITETMMMRNLDRAISSLRGLKAVGVRVALDDFGSGYSNLDYVKHFPIDKLKIDRMFVKNLGQDAKGLLLVDAIVKLAKSLNLCIVAEGVEIESQREFLKEIGCDVVQGYLTGRPLAREVFEQFLQQR